MSLVGGDGKLPWKRSGLVIIGVSEAGSLASGGINYMPVHDRNGVIVDNLFAYSVNVGVVSYREFGKDRTRPPSSVRLGQAVAGVAQGSYARGKRRHPLTLDKQKRVSQRNGLPNVQSILFVVGDAVRVDAASITQHRQKGWKGRPRKPKQFG